MTRPWLHLMLALGFAIAIFCPTGLAESRVEPPKPPPAVGEEEARASLTIWFIDDSQVAAGWDDVDQFQHRRLLELLRGAGHRPRIEHISEDDLASRWKAAKSQGRLPQLLAATRWEGELQTLDQAHTFKRVASTRLAVDDLPYPDFGDRTLVMPKGSVRASESHAALRVLMERNKSIRLPGPALTAEAGRAQAEFIARRAVIAFQTGSPERLRMVASKRSCQLARCKIPSWWHADKKVETGEVAIRGKGSLALALVDTYIESDDSLWCNPIAVVLVKEGLSWKAVTLSHDLKTVKHEVPALCLLLDKVSGSAGDLPAAELVQTPDRHVLRPGQSTLAWDVPEGGEPVLAQVFEQHFNDSADNDSRWPEVKFRVLPPEPRGGTIEPFQPVLAGDRMTWTVWTIGQSGQIAVAPARRFSIGL